MRRESERAAGWYQAGTPHQGSEAGQPSPLGTCVYAPEGWVQEPGDAGGMGLQGLCRADTQDAERLWIPHGLGLVIPSHAWI